MELDESLTEEPWIERWREAINDNVAFEANPGIAGRRNAGLSRPRPLAQFYCGRHLGILPPPNEGYSTIYYFKFVAGDESILPACPICGLVAEGRGPDL